MKTRMLALGLVLLFVINVAALLSFAYHRWIRQTDDAPSEPASSRVCIGEALSLSGKQQKCFQDIRRSFDSATEDIQAQIEKKRIALVEELKKNTPDMAAIDSILEEICGLQVEIQKTAVLHICQEKEVLTPEQKEKFCRIVESHVCFRDKKASSDPPGTDDAECLRQSDGGQGISF